MKPKLLISSTDLVELFLTYMSNFVLSSASKTSVILVSVTSQDALPQMHHILLLRWDFQGLLV
jgi:hypothetical protein